MHLLFDTIGGRFALTLAETLARLFRHPELIRLFSIQAHRRANALYTWGRVAEAVAGVYEAVAAPPILPIAATGRPGAVARPRRRISSR